MRNIENFSREELVAYIRELEETNNKLNRDVYFSDLNTEVDKMDKILLSESSQFLVDFFNNGNFSSLRNFAEQSNIGPGKMSEIFSGKRHLTLALIKKLETSELYERRNIVKLELLVEKETKQREATKQEIKSILTHKPSQPSEIESESINLMDHWSYYAIIAQINKNEGAKTLDWIASDLNLSETRTKKTLDTLCSMGIVKAKENQYFMNDEQSTFNSEKDEKVQEALMRMTDSIIRKSLDVHEKLEKPIHLRSDYFNCSLLADPERIETARKMLANYLYKIATYLEDGNSQEVYYLCAQLFPVEKV